MINIYVKNCVCALQKANPRAPFQSDSKPFKGFGEKKLFFIHPEGVRHFMARLGRQAKSTQVKASPA
jgi:hypothetical protein